MDHKEGNVGWEKIVNINGVGTARTQPSTSGYGKHIFTINKTRCHSTDHRKIKQINTKQSNKIKYLGE